MSFPTPNNRHRGGSLPSNGRIIVVLACTIVLSLVALWSIVSISQKEKQENQRMRTAWDNSRPAFGAVEVVPGAGPVHIPRTIGTIDGGWHSCNMGCIDHPIGHYPTLYPAYRLIYEENTSRVLTKNNQVRNIWAAATTGSANFTLQLSADGRKLTLRGPSGHTKSSFMLWSKDPKASRKS